jgi:hypothetical protein
MKYYLIIVINIASVNHKIIKPKYSVACSRSVGAAGERDLLWSMLLCVAAQLVCRQCLSCAFPVVIETSKSKPVPNPLARASSGCPAQPPNTSNNKPRFRASSASLPSRTQHNQQLLQFQNPHFRHRPDDARKTAFGTGIFFACVRKDPQRGLEQQYTSGPVENWGTQWRKGDSAL